MSMHSTWMSFRSLTADQSVKNQKLRPGTLKRIASFAVPYKASLTLFLITVVIDAFLIVATPLLLRRLIDEGVIPKNTELVTNLAIAVGVIAVADALFSMAGRWFSSRIGEGLIYDLRKQIFEHVQKQSIAFFTRTQTGALISRLNSDVIGAQQAFTSTLSGVISNLLSLILVALAMFTLSWQITLISLVLLPVFLIPTKWVGRKLQGYTRQSFDLNAQMSATMTERFNVSGALLVSLYGDSKKEKHEFAEKARSFASGEYASALMKGSDLTDEEFDKIATQYAALTGLSIEYVRRANLRVKEPQFSQELLRTERMSVGRLDARYKGINENLLSEGTSYDPQSSSISPPYISAFLDYYYNELKVNKMLTYKTSAYSTPGFTWDWKHKKNHVNWDPVTPNTAVDLAEVMSRNPYLKVLAINGYYDLATPFYAAEYTLKHMGLDKRIQSNIILKYYESGHMMYIDPASGKQFKDDIIEFINLALK